MSQGMALVGLDVHQAQTVAAVLDPLTGELGVERLRGAPALVVLAFLEELGRPVRAVYEAGPSGFGLARAAAERGIDVRVVAPGSIPRAPGDRVKTDRRDARRLVRLFAAGELSFAFVPSETDERFRDLVRCIEDARKDLMRSRHRLSKFLLRHGLRFTGRAWTQPYQCSKPGSPRSPARASYSRSPRALRRPNQMAARKPPARPKPRYRVVCYELIGEDSNVLMDDTSAGFIAATGTITRGVMTAELLTAGSHDVQAHLAITIADDELLARLTGRHSRPRPR